MLIPEETIVPQIAHQLCRLLQARVVRDPHLILLQRLTSKLVNQSSLRSIHRTSHLPKYLVGEPLHLGGILGIAFGSARVGEKLGGLCRDHSSCHLASSMLVV